MLIVVLIVLIVIIVLLLFPVKKSKEIINYVFINKKTKKYHQDKCPYAKNLESIALEDAQEEGYTPCKICNK